MKYWTYIVIGIQHTGDVLCQISVQNSLDVISNINYKQFKVILFTPILYYIHIKCTYYSPRNLK